MGQIITVSKMSLSQFQDSLGTLADPKDSRDFKISFRQGKPILTIPEPVSGFEEGNISILPTSIVPGIPAQYDLRKYMPPIEDQGGMPWCASYAVAAGIDFFALKDSKEFVDFCEEWAYKEARIMAGIGSSARDGVYIRSVLKLAQQTGFLPAKEWRAITHKPKKRGRDLEKILNNYKIKTYARVSPRTLANVKQSILNFGPLFSAFYIYEDWKYVGRKGKINMPRPGERRLGGHAILLVGWDNKKNSFIGRNSWGDWGLDGYCYISYEYFKRFGYSCWSGVDVTGSKDLYDKNAWEKHIDSLPKWWKKMWGIPY